MVMAAGRGERMRPLTDHTPKPLLPVRGKPLIVWHLEALARAGFDAVVINTAWLEERIVDALGDGSRWGLSIAYSMEGRDHGGALETAGGVAKALPLLDESFWLISGDIYAPGFEFTPDALAHFATSGDPARLWLAPNPPFHPGGDFGIDARGCALAEGSGPDGRRWTYSNFGLFRSSFFAGITPGTRAPLGPMLFAAMRQGCIPAIPYPGEWHNVGTPEQLAQLADNPPTADDPAEVTP